MNARAKRWYAGWFYAGAVYNVVWGAFVCLFPAKIALVTCLPPPIVIQLPFLQAIGMMVASFGYGYYLLARDPLRYFGFIWIALFGKVAGALGFLYSAWIGALPWSFGLVNLTNDVIWLPVFISFAVTVRFEATNVKASAEDAQERLNSRE
ncbi:MAG: hypothetical protein ABL962_02285 [Fimbriimonadaceae bacterium]